MFVKASEENRYIIENYDILYSTFGLNSIEIQKILKSQIEENFGTKISESHLYKFIRRNLPKGTYLHEFFEYMIKDFKGKYGKDIDKKHPKHLLNEVSIFIKNEYGFGGLNEHERLVLSRVLNRRKDIVFVGKPDVTFGGKSKGKPGYFKS